MYFVSLTQPNLMVDEIIRFKPNFFYRSELTAKITTMCTVCRFQQVAVVFPHGLTEKSVVRKRIFKGVVALISSKLHS